jgi:hypothetical protein
LFSPFSSSRRALSFFRLSYSLSFPSLIIPLHRGEFYLSARHRGKELALVATPLSQGAPRTFVWNFGLVLLFPLDRFALSFLSSSNVILLFRLGDLSSTIRARRLLTRCSRSWPKIPRSPSRAFHFLQFQI